MTGGIFSGLIQWLLGLLFRRPGAAERAGRAEAQLEQERKANEIVTQGAAVRADAADRVADSLQSDDPKAELKRKFPGRFRD